ncbi:MAG: cytochrome c oxidase assembly factor Coa1 family protein [Pirellulaceae bacterium]
MNFEIEQKTKKTNWLLWILVLGGVLVVVPIACCAGVGLLGFNAVKAPLVAAAAAMEENPSIVEKLGTPINYDSLQITNYQNNNGNGSADIDTNFSGPNGSAHVVGTMQLIAGEWSIQNMSITFGDGTEMQLP